MQTYENIMIYSGLLIIKNKRSKGRRKDIFISFQLLNFSTMVMQNDSSEIDLDRC